MSLMGLREYARHKGVNLNAVQVAIKTERISTVKKDGKLYIDSEKADIDWEKNTKGQYNKDKPGKNDGPSYNMARAIRETYQAKITKLDYEEKVKKLINAEQVENRVFELTRRTRNKLMVFPSKISHEIANMTESHEIQILIEKEINQALAEITDVKFTNN